MKYKIDPNLEFAIALQKVYSDAFMGEKRLNKLYFIKVFFFNKKVGDVIYKRGSSLLSGSCSQSVRIFSVAKGNGNHVSLNRKRCVVALCGCGAVSYLSLLQKCRS